MMDAPIQILVIDDDAIDRAMVRRALKASDFHSTIVEAETSASALSALSQSSFDCILLDYRLPDADGLDVLHAFHAAGVRTPVIVLTGQGDEQVAVDLMKAGATDYLSKSRISPDRLVQSIRQALRVQQAEQQANEAKALQQQAEAALRQNERLLAITLKSIGDAVIATDATGSVSFMNQMAESLTGWDAQTATGHAIERVLPLLHAHVLVPHISPPAQVLKLGTTIEIHDDVLAETRDGRRVPVAISGAPIRSDDGTLVGVVVVVRDMTEQVRTAERLHFMANVSQVLTASLDYEDTLARLAHRTVPHLADFCAIDVTRPDTTIERIAVAANAQVQTESRSTTTGSVVDASQPYGSPTVMRTAQTEYYPDVSADAPHHLWEDHQTFIKVTGLISWICVPLIVRQGTLGAITLGRTAAGPRFTPEDVTFMEELARRAALAIDNALLYQDAQEAIATRDAFLSIAAHELKTPLTALQGYIELLQRRLTRTPQVEERDYRTLQVITDQSRRLTKMIHALFDLSRLQIGQLTIERTPVDIGRLATRITTEIEPTLERHTLHLTVADQPLLILGDELRLEQVIQNVLHNAMKYSPAGGPVAVRVDRHDEWVRLSVQDEGIGIPSESLANLFQRFYRATNTASHRISGMGVGLYVTRQIVELHGGRIAVDSVEGQGSTFHIWLPIYAGPVGEGRSPAVEGQPEVTNRSDAGKR